MRIFGDPLARRLGGLALGQNAGAVTYAQYVASLNLLLWLRLRETAGSVAANSGSGGTALDGSIGGTTTLGQAGAGGIVNEAFLLDGLTSRITIANDASIQGNQFWFAFLLNPASAGEGNQGRFYSHDGTQQIRFQNALTALAAILPDTGVTITTTGLTAGQWAWVFGAYDDSAAILGDKKYHLYKGQNGVVTEYSYSTFDAVGTFGAPASSMIIGNNAAQSTTYDGLIDDVLRSNTLPTSSAALLAIFTKLTQLRGV